MSSSDAHSPSRPNFDPPDGSPLGAVAPISVKDAHRAAEQAFRSYRSSVDNARDGLSRAEKDYAASVKRAERGRAEAASPSKIASIGVVRKVTLSETTIRTPKGEFPLTPDVEARAEQHGNKQVVQGWVFKSDNDRREVYLHLTGPNWADVVPFSMKHSFSQPRDLHSFAAQITAAARNADAARARIARRVAEADERRAAAIVDRAAVEQAAEAFVGIAHATVELNAAAETAKAILDNADPSERHTAKAREALSAMSAQAWAWADEAVAARRRVSDESASARAQAQTVPAEAWPVSQPPGPARDADALERADANARRGGVDAPDIIDQIRKLGELRDAGLLTPGEFDAKKMDLLSRL
jgi:hypothetical protein